MMRHVGRRGGKFREQSWEGSAVGWPGCAWLAGVAGSLGKGRGLRVGWVCVLELFCVFLGHVA